MPRRNYFALAMIGSISLFCWQATQGAKPKDEMLELYGLFVDAVEKVESQLRPPGIAPRAARERPGRDAPEPRPALLVHQHRASGSSSASRSRASSAGSASRSAWTPRPAGCEVIAPMVGTPAYEAGVLAGDQIMEIDGQSDRGHEPRQGRRGPDRPARHRRQAQRPARGRRGARDDHDHPGDHRRAQRPGRPPQARRLSGTS